MKAEPRREPAFRQTSVFSRKWDKLNLGHDDLIALETQIMEAPGAAAIVVGTGGLRKIRFAPEGRGRSGAYRVCYAHFEQFGVVLLTIIFAKNEKANLSAGEKNAIAKLLDVARRALEREMHS